ncbi:hypothetical protein QBC42DRAFT_94354 [Cladorrhinum samala]|uniref:Uncharacterized protein n=1 Tax=Cladorrhinum samala TaxID=585594 RepID=A0AAV9HQY9_9PEZI|nr:hypothetical protein QBC42DRAFT_94354 [Cladorrhinum samala]
MTQTRGVERGGHFSLSLQFFGGLIPVSVSIHKRTFTWVFLLFPVYSRILSYVFVDISTSPARRARKKNGLVQLDSDLALRHTLLTSFEKKRLFPLPFHFSPPLVFGVTSHRYPRRVSHTDKNTPFKPPTKR